MTTTQQPYEKQEIREWGDNFAPVITMQEPIIHTKDHPFCIRLSCPCHRDRTLIRKVFRAYRDGIITREEKRDIFRGLRTW